MPTKCIEHTQNNHPKGYGKTTWNKRGIGLHRKAYAIANGLTAEDIDGLVIRHKCDNPRCINPDHLEAGTVQDNALDCVQRGRHSLAKITPDIAQYIRDNYKAWHPEFGGRPLAKRFGIDASQVTKIAKGKAWTH